MWKHLKELRNEAPKEITHIKITNKEDICHQFNQHFTSDGQVSVQDGNLIVDPLTYLISFIFSLQKTTESEILSIIATLKNTSSFGPDQINNKIIKICADKFSSMISFLINDSIKVNNFPKF